MIFVILKTVSNVTAATKRLLIQLKNSRPKGNGLKGRF